MSPAIAELRSVPKTVLESIRHEKVTINDFQYHQKKFNLGRGEASILKYGETIEIVAIIDDLRARAIGIKIGIDVKGTMGLLGAGYVLCPIKTKEELITLFNKATAIGFRLPPTNSYLRKMKKKEHIENLKENNFRQSNI